MRLGPALLVALLPLLARANLTTGASPLNSSDDDHPEDVVTDAPTTASFASLISNGLPPETAPTSTSSVALFESLHHADNGSVLDDGLGRTNLPPTTATSLSTVPPPSSPVSLDQQHMEEANDTGAMDPADVDDGDEKDAATDGAEKNNADQTLIEMGNGSVDAANYKRKVLTVGYLTAVKGALKERQGLVVSGALTLALHEINTNPQILPNVTLKLRWNDTKGDTVVATRAMTDMICDGVSVFFGPEGSCHVEAIVSQSRNIPMISYKCSDYKASSVPTFARTEPPDTQVTKSVLALLLYYQWRKFSIIYEEVWETVAKSLESEAKNQNMTINDIKVVLDKHLCCEKNLKCCQSGYWYEFIQETKNRTRIYVFLGTSASLVDMMTTMHSAQLFDNGDYIVIYVDVNVYSEKEAHKYLWKPDVLKNASCDNETGFLKRAQSLLVIVPTAPTGHYENFTKKVREFNAMEPFYFVVPAVLLKYEKFISIYAAYLYDSVQLYAKALHRLLSQESNLDDEKIDEIASNGTLIIDTIKNIRTYKSITGANMKIDRNGDSEGNFSVLALQPVDFNEEIVKNSFSCSHQMRPVGQFLENNEVLPKYKSVNKIDWPVHEKVPSDEPSCGFNNEQCKKSDTLNASLIGACVLALLLFCAIVITISIYRKWKIEQEIEGLLWKIDRSEIVGYLDRDAYVMSPGRISIGSASVNSFESRTGAQVFASTAQFRGVMVRIKELTFSRKKDISREVMKEMRLLRELRHDNVNSFIGACVAPTSLLLVTDYCAKGSLYDVIENEDIKLDRMFVASLVHDLIKGMLYLHNSLLGCHGNLKSSNCVVTSRWVLQVTDFGLAEMRHCAENDSVGEHQYYRSLFWKAPEMLRHPTAFVRGTQKGDVYAFAIILYEIVGRRSPPFGTNGLEPKEIIDKIKRIPDENEEPFRPDLFLLQDTEFGCQEYILNCITDCWAEDPDARPDFFSIRVRLKKMKDGKNRNIMDQMMEMMVKYANHLEDLVTERTRLLNEEKMKTVDLLHRMLPKPVAEKLTIGCGIEPEWFDQVTIYFSDIVGFTAMSAESTPLQVVNFLNDLYTVFDRIIKGYDVYKVETIGDAYMVVSGLPVRNGEHHAGEIASMALDLLTAVKDHPIPHRPKETVKLRIGIHTGPVVAGVVGLTMPRYCLFGDTVNTASRMESNGEPLKIHISGKCKDALENLGGYIIEERGLVNMKGKGEVRTYWLTGATDDAIKRREVDLGELPPLFCRPRRGSIRLNSDSRQASFCAGNTGFGGVHSRRQSSVPRGTSVDVESCSTLHNPSPLPIRSYAKPMRNILHVPDVVGSKTTVNSTFGSQTIDPADLDTRKGIRPRRVLSSIASSCDEPYRSQAMLNRVRESKSLDLLPLSKKKRLVSPCSFFPSPTAAVTSAARRAARSLEDCDMYPDEIQIIAFPDNKLYGNFPNGNLFASSEDAASSIEDAKEPLLTNLPSTVNPTVRKRFGNGLEDVTDEFASKRWRSLESVRAGDSSNEMQTKKNLPRNSIKGWIVGFFNGNGLKTNTAVLKDYNSIQERESIV